MVIDMDNDADVLSAFKHVPGRKLLIASSLGNGFIVLEDDVIANTRKGKQVLNVNLPAEALICVEAAGDIIAVVGENRKLLCFPTSQIASNVSRQRCAHAKIQRWWHQGRARLLSK